MGASYSYSLYIHCVMLIHCVIVGLLSKKCIMLVLLTSLLTYVFLVLGFGLVLFDEFMSGTMQLLCTLKV